MGATPAYRWRTLLNLTNITALSTQWHSVAAISAHKHDEYMPRPRYLMVLGSGNVGDALEAAEYAGQGAPHAAPLVGQPVLEAERLHAPLDLPEVVAGEGGEEVVLDLAVEAAREPVVEQARVDVAGGGRLGADEVGVLVDEHVHAVVGEGEHDGKEGAAEALAHDHICAGLERGEGGEGVREEPEVVEGDAAHLERALLRLD
mmetsp:Transcript_5605/g.18978  ORF Transcript_5605/g.18978 Transcript_5605/m.18978 type:complete len:203 (-) Transcript_5605:1093-1701(-)